MKKQLAIIGIFALLVCVGFSGCIVFGTTSIKDIVEHPNRFINQTVVVKGKYISLSLADAVMDNKWNLYLLIPSNISKPIPFSQLSEYTFAGIVHYGKYWEDKEEVLYLEVTKIETI